MANVENVKDEQKQIKVQQDAYIQTEEDDTAEDYEYSDESFDESTPKQLQQKQQQLQRLPRQHQQLQQKRELQETGYDDNDYTDEFESSNEYEDSYYYDDHYNIDDDGFSSMSIVQQEKKRTNDEKGVKLRLDLNLEIEVELKARIRGDLTLSLMA